MKTSLTPADETKIILAVGADMANDVDWARIALQCLDQAGLSCAAQDEIAAMIRAAGVPVEDLKVQTWADYCASKQEQGAVA